MSSVTDLEPVSVTYCDLEVFHWRSSRGNKWDSGSSPMGTSFFIAVSESLCPCTRRTAGRRGRTPGRPYTTTSPFLHEQHQTHTLDKREEVFADADRGLLMCTLECVFAIMYLLLTLLQ
ncbi:hypothetical protein INR49_016652, partial [Caranx melampygus]